MIDAVLSAMRRASLMRSVIPVHVPLVALWTGRADDVAPAEHDPLHRELLDTIRRRVVYRRVVACTQLSGLIGAWVGVALPRGRVLTLVGVAVALVAALVSVIDKDRVAALNSDIGRLIDLQRRALGEWLHFELELPPYSYALTSAAGIRPIDVLRLRCAQFDPRVATRLLALAREDASGHLPSASWERIRAVLVKLQKIDVRGREQEKRILVAVDITRLALLAVLLATAVAVPTLNVPDAAMATVATLIALTGRSASDGAQPFSTAHPERDTVSVDATMTSTLASERTVEHVDSELLASVLQSWVSVPRSLSAARTRASITRAHE